jgi:hypothetical protein
MKTQTILQLDEADLRKVMAEELSELSRAAVLGQFAGRLVSADTVADIHDVHRDTVIRYATAGILPYIKIGKLWKFQLSEILTVNFHELKKQKTAIN